MSKPDHGKAPKRSKLWWWIGAVLVLIPLSPYLIIFIISLIGVQTKGSFIDDMRTHGADSESIHLERYRGDIVFDAVGIPKGQFQDWATALPGGIGWMHRSITKCWVPHHRIRFDGPSSTYMDGKASIDICFSCDEIRPEGGTRSHIPRAWREPLRQLFEDAGISVEPPSQEDVNTHYEELLKEAGQ